MKPAPFAYHAPGTRDEVLALLAELGEDGKLLAGGQSLVPLLNMRLAVPEAIVDLAHVDGLDRIEVTDGAVRVEARVTQEALRRHEAATAMPLLGQALAWVAHPAIRNRGTVVGSLVHADPAAELPAVFALLDGQVELASAETVRTVTGTDYFLGPLESDTKPEELAVAAVFPLPPPRTGTAFAELARRQGDYALAGVATAVTLDDDARIAHARVAFLGVAGTPVVIDLDGALAGQPHNHLDVGDAVAHARGSLDPTGDIHASAAYRLHIAGVLLAHALEDAAATAGDAP